MKEAARTTPTGRLTQAEAARYAELGSAAHAAGMERIDWPSHPAFTAEALSGIPGSKARRAALIAFQRGWDAAKRRHERDEYDAARKSAPTADGEP